jgi:hypothetical protein
MVLGGSKFPFIRIEDRIINPTQISWVKVNEDGTAELYMVGPMYHSTLLLTKRQTEALLSWSDKESLDLTLKTDAVGF